MMLLVAVLIGAAMLALTVLACQACERALVRWEHRRGER